MFVSHLLFQIKKICVYIYGPEYWENVGYFHFSLYYLFLS